VTWTPLLWLLAFFPALVALYFLKLRRQSLVVSSTLLWRRSIEDLHVNAPFQRLRRNLLLLLQLLILLGVVLAAWRPRISGVVAHGRQIVLLIDNSASMRAEEDGGTRLELAKKEALAVTDGMSEGDRMVVLSFSAKTTTVEALTSDPHRLRRAISRIRATDLPTDLAQALQVAASIAETLPSSEIYVIGDGCYGDLTELPDEVKGQNLRFVATGTPLANVAITELDVRRSFEKKKRTEVFTLVENLGAEAVRVTCSLHVGDQLSDARELEIGPGQSQAVVFEGTSLPPGLSRVEIGGEDAFPLDDEGWFRIVSPPIQRILVVGESDNGWLDLVLQAAPQLRHVRVSPSHLARLEALETAEAVREQYDVDALLFDRHCPKTAPLLPTLYLGCYPDLPVGIAPPREFEYPAIVDWDRTHPINRFIVFTDLWIEKARVFSSGEGIRSLLDVEDGSVIAALEFPTPGGRPTPAVIVGFDILDSNWPVGHYSFPIFFSNALGWLSGGLGRGEQARSRTGESLVYTPQAGDELEDLVFVSPSGVEYPATRETTGAWTYSAADEVGVHHLRSAAGEVSTFPVALLNRRESNLVPDRVVDFGDFEIAVEASLGDEAFDTWKWFALAALLFLLVEWHVYNRRLLG
jgi:hypothetical protein